MNVCIVGTGAAGWLTAFKLNKLDFIKKITIIGSPAIPTIGVGESTTINFIDTLSELFPNKTEYHKFLIDIDAAVKYGVYYDGWSHKNFLHAFVGNREVNYSGYLLGNLPKDVDENYYMMPLYDEILKNNLRAGTAQNFSFHFDANKLISAFEKRSKHESKITHLKDTVVESIFNDNLISEIYLSDGTKVKADYFVSCVGQTAFNQKIFHEEYIEYSNVLLTDKALFTPLKYKNKRDQFHPYTIARTMKYGWRWITPTWSRIGTGYAFSSKYVSTDEAISEFTNNISDSSIEPFQVDFYPRRIKESFKPNHCCLGMASGFLEPLDAPGLGILLNFVGKLSDILKNKCENKVIDLNFYNKLSREVFDFWSSFILHQYKTSTREDTQFWIDHKNVKFDPYDKIIYNLENATIENDELTFQDKDLFMPEPWMFYHTSLGKGLRWKVNSDKTVPIRKLSGNFAFENHYDYFLKLRLNNSFFT